MAHLTTDQIRESHIIDDLCKEVAALRRQTSLARDLLRDVAHMIDHGSLDTAKEHVDRAQTALS